MAEAERQITHQSLTVTIGGKTHYGGSALPDVFHRREVNLSLEVDPESDDYSAQHAAVESAVIGALNEVQQELARERGEEGF